MTQQTIVNAKRSVSQAVNLQPGGATITVEVPNGGPFSGFGATEVVTQASGQQTFDGRGATGVSKGLMINPKNLTGPSAAVNANVGLAGPRFRPAARVQRWNPRTARGFSGDAFLGSFDLSQPKTLAMVGIAAAAAWFLFLRKK